MYVCVCLQHFKAMGIPSNDRVRILAALNEYNSLDKVCMRPRPSERKLFVALRRKNCLFACLLFAHVLNVSLVCACNRIRMRGCFIHAHAKHERLITLYVWVCVCVCVCVCSGRIRGTKVTQGNS